MTGGAFTASAREFLARIPNLSITKPFEADTLTRATRVTLARLARTRRAAS